MCKVLAADTFRKERQVGTSHTKEIYRHHTYILWAYETPIYQKQRQIQTLESVISDYNTKYDS